MCVCVLKYFLSFELKTLLIYMLLIILKIAAVLLVMNEIYYVMQFLHLSALLAIATSDQSKLLSHVNLRSRNKISCCDWLVNFKTPPPYMSCTVNSLLVLLK